MSHRALKVKFLLKKIKKRKVAVSTFLKFYSNRSLYATTLRGQTAAAGTFLLLPVKITLLLFALKGLALARLKFNTLSRSRYYGTSQIASIYMYSY